MSPGEPRDRPRAPPLLPLRRTRRAFRRLLASTPLLGWLTAPLAPRRPRRHRKVGLPPGTLVYTGPARGRPTRLTVTTFDEGNFREQDATSVESALALRVRPGVSWINVEGLEDTGVIREIGEHFRIDPLLLEDLVHVGQRPKVEVRESYLFIVLRMFSLEADGQRVRHEQVSMVLGHDFLLTFQESEGDTFEPVRSRLREGRGRVRARSADYLAYALLDTIVDNYFVVLERLSDAAERLEEVVLSDRSDQPELVPIIHRLRRENITLRKAVWPVRELIGSMIRGEVELIREDTRPFLRDVQDHTMEIIETVETLRDMIGGLLEIHLSMVSNRMNEVMKVLTIIATIFVPLTFVVGIYGMNFEYMPELEVWWAYPVVWLVMLTIVGGLLIFFRRRKWL